MVCRHGVQCCSETSPLPEPKVTTARAQRHLDRNLRLVDQAVSRSACGAFMLQTPILIGLAFALRELTLPAEVKALALAVSAVVVSFGLARLLIEHVPGMRRLL